MLAALWLVAGCHSYVPIAVPELSAGAPVRVRLTDRGSVDLAAALGPRASALDGRVAERRDSALVLRVASVRRTNGVEEGWLNEPVRVPLGAVANVERERVSPLRSGLLAAGLVAVVALLASTLGGDDNPVQGGPGGGLPGGSK